MGMCSCRVSLLSSFSRCVESVLSSAKGLPLEMGCVMAWCGSLDRILEKKHLKGSFAGRGDIAVTLKWQEWAHREA